MRAFEGLVQVQIGQSRSEVALRLIQDELSKAPDFIELRVLLARTAARVGNLDLAVVQYKQLVAKNPGVPDWYLPLGEALRARGDFAGALGSLKPLGGWRPKMPGSP